MINRAVLGQLISSNNIAFDATTNGGSATATSLTFAHVCSGTNLILFVAIQGSGSDVITGVSYNGVSMARVDKALCPSSVYVYLYALVAPAIGSNNVVISASGSITIKGLSASYTGVTQGALDASGTNTVSGYAANADFPISATVVASNSWMICVAGNTGSFTPTPGISTTSRQTTTNFGMFDSNGPLTPGSHSLNSRVAGLENHAGVCASFSSISTFLPSARTLAASRTVAGLRTKITNT